MKTMRKRAAAWRRHLTNAFLFAACLAMMFDRTALADEVATTGSDGAAAKSAQKDSADGKSKSAAASENLGQRKQGDVTESEKLGYRESKVAAEMTELEERMYRLSEALKRLEPENSSRLMSGVKYARTELIQHEMHEIEQILTKSDYKLASGQEKELLAKLARLEQMLLSTDLDLQMQLQKLRAIRDILHRLDSAIKEEDSEQKQSTASTDRDKEMQNLPALREKLAELIRQQTAHVAAATQLSGESPVADKSEDAAKPAADAPPPKKDAVDAAPPTAEKLLTDQRQTRDDTKSLEERLAQLSEAREQMEQALSPLEKSSVREALPHQKDALESLKKLAAALEAKQKELTDALSQDKFNGMRRQQEQNRGATDKISDMVKELGDSGAGAAGELARAGTSMSSAEGRLGNRQPEPAGQDQGDALNSLKYAREQLEEEEQQLLNKIRGEVKKRVMEGITEMIERQASVRESTEKLSPRLKEASRSVLNAVVGLSKSEEQIMQIGEGLIGLVEETEFGIALPAALRSVVDEMDDVKRKLAGGEASPPVVDAERQIEADLKELLNCLKQLPTTGKPSDEKSQNAQSREREINRLLAELKMIRMLQVRVNRDTKQADEKRAAELERLTAETRQKIEAIHDRQQDVHDVTEKLNTQRGNELQ
jgi:hypothetical protein